METIFCARGNDCFDESDHVADRVEQNVTQPTVPNARIYIRAGKGFEGAQKMRNSVQASSELLDSDIAVARDHALLGVTTATWDDFHRQSLQMIKLKYKADSRPVAHVGSLCYSHCITGARMSLFISWPTATKFLNLDKHEDAKTITN